MTEPLMLPLFSGAFLPVVPAGQGPDGRGAARSPCEGGARHQGGARLLAQRVQRPVSQHPRPGGLCGVQTVREIIQGEYSIFIILKLYLKYGKNMEC